METVVYIQAGDDGFPVDDWAFSAYLGYKMKGSKIVLFKDLAEVPRNKYTLLVACVEYTRQWFEDMGITINERITMPEPLRKYAGRDIEVCKIKDIYSVWNNFGGAIFVKPYSKIKAFNAALIKTSIDIDMWIPKDNPEMEVIISNAINIISEYRCYIESRDIIGIFNYSGMINQYPEYNIIQSMVDDFKNQPKGYTLDVGITQDLQTVLIEVNDGWSIGNYGLNHYDYTTLLSARWRELLTQNSNK